MTFFKLREFNLAALYLTSVVLLSSVVIGKVVLLNLTEKIIWPFG